MAWQIVTENHIPQPIQALSTTAVAPIGYIAQAIEPQLGFGEFIYLPGVASVAAGDLVQYDLLAPATTRGSFTANNSWPIAVAMAPCVAGNFGWFQISGMAICANNATAAVNSNAFHVAAAATLSSTAVAGRQILGAVIRTANGSTFTKTCTTRLGSNILQVPNLDGLFVGLPISGTGIPGGTTIAAGVDSQPFLNANQILMSANATADGTVTVTFTRTNFSVVAIQRPVGQGQIT